MASSNKVNTYSFLTTVPNELVATVNHERVVILTKPEEFDQWLNGSVEEAIALAKPLPSEKMRIVKAVRLLETA